MRPVRANGDKPHRCPQCHGIPPKAWEHGRARRTHLYRCERCGLVWWRCWQDWTIRERVAHRREMRRSR